MPLLHRPTFEKSVSEGLHRTNAMFGATLLLVCAHGARYSDDPRVLAAESPRSAGWRWFEQVNILRKSLYHRTSLYELQMHVVSLGGWPINAWTLFSHQSPAKSCMSFSPTRAKCHKGYGPKSDLLCACRRRSARTGNVPRNQMRRLLLKTNYGSGHFGEQELSESDQSNRKI